MVGQCLGGSDPAPFDNNQGGQDNDNDEEEEGSSKSPAHIWILYIVSALFLLFPEKRKEKKTWFSWFDGWKTHTHINIYTGC